MVTLNVFQKELQSQRDRYIRFLSAIKHWCWRAEDKGWSCETTECHIVRTPSLGFSNSPISTKLWLFLPVVMFYPLTSRRHWQRPLATHVNTNITNELLKNHISFKEIGRPIAMVVLRKEPVRLFERYLKKMDACSSQSVIGINKCPNNPI